MEYKIKKTSLVSWTIAFELVMLNSPFSRKSIQVITSHCVNKRPQDLRHYEDRHFELKFSQSKGKIRKTYCRAYLTSVCDPLTC